jgi:lipopolysaccharide transport system ATP-binding protein
MTIIHLKNVSLDIPIYGMAKSLRSKMFSTFTGGKINVNNKFATVKALDNISINLDSGDRLGLVGHNGSGKSSLLKVMAGIYEPLVGDIRVSGSVVSLFNNSLGLDVDKTGRENIKNIAYLLGMRP